MAQLQRDWRPVDLVDLQHRYSQAVTAANESGDNEAYALLPAPDAAEFFQGGFVRGGAPEASYNVSAGWGGHYCIFLRVGGSPPNNMALQARDGEC